MIANKYKGFWDPDLLYMKDDVVEYYKLDGSGVVLYNTKEQYVLSKDMVNASQSEKCPLTNFTQPNPVLTKLVLEGIIDVTPPSDPNTSVWADTRYATSTWIAPHGTSAQGLNTNYWTVFVGAENSNRSSTATQVNQQSYSSQGQSTVSTPKYGNNSIEEIDFEGVTGETDSDSYYLSNVQNYNDIYEVGRSYEKFDIVRDEYAKDFFYARRNINTYSSEYDFVVDGAFESPTEFASNSQADGYVGNLRLDESSTISFNVGDILIYNNIEYVVLQKEIVEDPALSKLYYLGRFGNDYEVLENTTLTDAPFSKNKFDISPGGSDAVWSRDDFFFDADYGSTVSFEARNKQYEFGDGYKSVAPLGVNSLRMNMDLKFSNRTSKEANSILHFVENHLGQHESDEDSLTLEYDLGISGFNMDGESLFFPYNNNLNINRKFYCFEFDHMIEQENVEDIDLKIFNNDASTLQQAEGLFVNPAPQYIESSIYNQHDVVFHLDNKKYYYSYSEEPHDYNPYDAVNKASINAQAWTREFYWSPSLEFSIKHVPQIQEVSYPSSTYSQYFPKHKQHVNLMEMDLEFANRSDKEAYAILHFLESHLGCKSFIFTPPAPYNRKRRFYCESWSHTYVFKNNHKISANFKQFPAGQNAPLTDDEIDQLVPELEIIDGRISGTSSVDFDITQSDSTGSHYVKTVVLSNIGETNVTITGVEPAAQNEPSPFAKSVVGLYKKQYSVGGTNYSLSVTDDSSIESNRVVKLKHNSSLIFYAEDGFQTGVVTDANGGETTTTSKLATHPDDFIDENLTIGPGEKRYLEVYFNSSDKLDTTNPAYFNQSKIKIKYKDDNQDESEFNISISATINKDLLNENKYKKNITIYSEDVPTRDPVVFDVNSNTDNILAVHKTTPNQFNDLVVSCSQDSHNLAVFNDLLEARAAFDINTNAQGFLITGIIKKAGENVYRDYKNGVQIDWLVSPDANDPTTSERIDSPVSIDDHADRDNSKDGVLCVEYSSRDFGFTVFDQEDCLVKTNNHLRESRGSSAFNNLNIANFIRSKFLSPEESLENILDLTVNLIGTFSSSSASLPAVELGHGYNSDCAIKVNVGLDRYYKNTPNDIGGTLLSEDEYLEPLDYQSKINGNTIQDWQASATYSVGDIVKHEGVIYVSKKNTNTNNDPETLPSSGIPSWVEAYRRFLQQTIIVGKGGRGGSGAISEGVIYESGHPVNRDTSLYHAGNGEKGGDALKINQITKSIDIVMSDGSSIYAGGGGGAGGGFLSSKSRKKTQKNVNIGGGGGGGAGLGLGGFPNGANGSLDATYGAGGIAINNVAEEQYALMNGGSGGDFGKAGRGVFSSFVQDSKYFEGEVVRYKPTGGIDCFYRKLDNLPEDATGSFPQPAASSSNSWEKLEDQKNIGNGLAGQAGLAISWGEISDGKVKVSKKSFNSNTEVILLDDGSSNAGLLNDLPEENFIDVKGLCKKVDRVENTTYYNYNYSNE